MMMHMGKNESIEPGEASQRSSSSIANDVEIIGRISAVPTILQVVAQITGMRFTAVARVTERKWVACAVYDKIAFGLQPGGELVLESTICNEIRQHHQAVLFGHASQHSTFSTHPTPKLYGFESYASIPIFRSNGDFWGTLCAIDPLPAKLDDPTTLQTLELFAQLISSQLEIEESLQRSGSDLLDAQQAAKLRDQFIAVLGHDLRNPINAIGMSADVLGMSAGDVRTRTLIDGIKRSCRRMGALVNDILDFARGRLGSGIPVTLKEESALGSTLEHVISEVQTSYPARVFVTSIDVPYPVLCDVERLSQLFGNLLGNAAMHGLPDSPIVVTLRGDERKFEMEVANAGAIPADRMQQLFQPFYRSETGGKKEGLGLGLFIASEIATAHGSTLHVVSSPERGTRFSLRLDRSVRH
jgi:signal transduction histidine kinase